MLTDEVYDAAIVTNEHKKKNWKLTNIRMIARAVTLDPENTFCVGTLMAPIHRQPKNNAINSEI